MATWTPGSATSGATARCASISEICAGRGRIFGLMFDGIIEDLQARDRNVLNLVIRDKLQRLNTPVTETLLVAAPANKDRLIPVLLGECHNIEPLLTNPATLEYQVHGSAMEDFIEVRDNGVVVSVTESVSTGKFTLSAALKGTITCSAQGDKPSTYSNTVQQAGAAPGHRLRYRPV